MKIRTAFIRHIALGDCLLSLPIIKQYKSERSEHQIYLFTCTKIIDANQYIRKVFEIRLKYQSIIKNYHKVMYLDYEFFPKLHILDAYSLVTGINLKEKIIPFVIKEKYKNKAKKILNIFRIKQPYVCINVQTGHHLRNYPLNKAQEIINCIKVKGFEVIVLADTSNNLNNCVNLSKFKFNIKIVAGIIAKAHSFIGIDSGLLHIAQSQCIPVVGIFGATSPELRVTNPYKIQIAANKNLDCLGCYHNIREGSENLRECFRKDIACMNDLDSKTVIEKWESVIKGIVDQDLLLKIENYISFFAKIKNSPETTNLTILAVENYKERLEQFLIKNKFSYKQYYFSKIKDIMKGSFPEFYIKVKNILSYQ